MLAAATPIAGSSEPGPRRPRVGLVLSGGGARGGAHIGVLKVLEELHVPVDYVVGTSMGSIVGGLYCAGLSPRDMETSLGRIDWEFVLTNKPERRRISFRRKEDDNLALFPIELGVGRRGLSTSSGILAGTKIDFVLRGLTLGSATIRDFDQLHLPYRAVAADLATGEAVILDHGDLTTAIRASMSIPGVFTPVEIEGRILVDGGIALNLPVDVARDMGADRIIAVDVGTPPRNEARGLSPAGVLSQMISVLTEKSVEEQRARIRPNDLLIAPDLDKVTTADFAKIDVAVAAGEEAARRHEDELRAFSVPEEEYEAFRRRQRRGGGTLVPEVRVDRVRVEVHKADGSRQASEMVARRVETRPGGALEVKTLYRDLERISQAGEFESVGFRMEREADRNVLVIEAREKSWGPGYLRFGLGVEGSLEGDSEFRAIGNYRRPGLNHLGAEWKTNLVMGDPAGLLTELYQPLDPSGFWFVAPRLSYERDKEETFLPSGDREVLKTRSGTAGLDFGIQLRNYGEIRLGVLGGRVNVDPTTTSTFTPIERDVGGMRLKATLDQIDNVFFPTHGNLSELQIFLSRDALGADDEYDKLQFETLHAWTVGKNTFVGSVLLGTDLGSDLPFFDQFELGGFLNLSGFQRGSLRGDVKGLFRLADYWRIGKLGALGRLYAGMALEAGNVWPDIHDADLGNLLYSGLLFLGLDTKFSPVYVGYAVGEGGESQEYLFIGRPF